MIRTMLGVLAALIIKDVIRWESEKLRWRMQVNRVTPRPTPWKLQIVRMLAGKQAQYGEQ